MIKVQTLSPPESSSAATTGKPSRHQTSVRYSCRRLPRVHKPPDRTNRDPSRTPRLDRRQPLRIDQLMDAVAAYTQHRGIITKREQHSLHDHLPSVGHRWSLVGVSASPTGDGVVSAWPSWASLRSVPRTASLRPLIRKGASRELPTFGRLSVRKELNVIPARSACRGNRTVPVTALAGVPSITTSPTTTPFFRTGCCPDATRQ